MLDVAVDTPASQMLILDRTQGIVGVPFTKPGVSAVQGPPAARRALSTPQPMQQPPLPVAPDAQAPAVAETLDAAVAGLIPPAALAGRVGGALSAPGPSNPLAVFVAGLVDALPKQVGTSVDITAQLAGKAARLESLLEVLHQAGLLADLTPELLRCASLVCAKVCMLLCFSYVVEMCVMLTFPVNHTPAPPPNTPTTQGAV